jgi:hypothetical protein
MAALQQLHPAGEGVLVTICGYAAAAAAAGRERRRPVSSSAAQPAFRAGRHPGIAPHV